jgi:hypothetical protein
MGEDAHLVDARAHELVITKSMIGRFRQKARPAWPAASRARTTASAPPARTMTTTGSILICAFPRNRARARMAASVPIPRLRCAPAGAPARDPACPVSHPVAIAGHPRPGGRRLIRINLERALPEFDGVAGPVPQCKKLPQLFIAGSVRDRPRGRARSWPLLLRNALLRR